MNIKMARHSKNLNSQPMTNETWRGLWSLKNLRALSTNTCQMTAHLMETIALQALRNLREARRHLKESQVSGIVPLKLGTQTLKEPSCSSNASILTVVASLRNLAISGIISESTLARDRSSAASAVSTSLKVATWGGTLRTFTTRQWEWRNLLRFRFLPKNSSRLLARESPRWLTWARSRKFSSRSSLRPMPLLLNFAKATRGEDKVASISRTSNKSSTEISQMPPIKLLSRLKGAAV